MILVNRDFQLRYAKAAVAVGVVSTVLTGSLILFPLFVFEILRIPRFLPVPVMVSMALAMLVNIALIAVMAIFMTHKVAGPVYSIVRSLRAVGVGYWGRRLGTREDDEFQFVVRNFNEMLDGICGLSLSDQKRIREIQSSLESGNQAKAIEGLKSLDQSISARLVAQGPEQ